MEADHFSVFSEASSADIELVLSDETVSVVANSAGSGVLAVLSGVTVKLVGHLF